MADEAPAWSELRERGHRCAAPFAFVIPLYNHARNVRAVTLQAAASGAPVVVVDDGSTDGSLAAVTELAGVTVIQHQQNRGKGAALRTGLAAVAAAPIAARFAVTVDADGQHLPDEARRLLAEVLPGEGSVARAALVVGVRAGMEAESVPWSSRMGRRFSGFWVWACGGSALADSQSGFRVYPVAETLALPTRARRFEFEVEVLVQARRADLPVVEVPVSVSYAPPGGRVSHFRPWRDFVRNAVTFTRLLATRWLPRRRLPRSRP